MMKGLKDRLYIIGIAVGCVLAVMLWIATGMIGSNLESQEDPPIQPIYIRPDRNALATPGTRPRIITLEQKSADSRSANKEELAAAVGCIGGQLQAMRQDDYAKAFTFQSADLQQSFGTPAALRAAMPSTYPQVAHNKSMTYGAAMAARDGSHITIPVSITGEDGTTVATEYHLTREDSGYKVGSVMGGLPTGLGPHGF